MLNRLTFELVHPILRFLFIYFKINIQAKLIVSGYKLFGIKASQVIFETQSGEVTQW